MFGGLKEFFSPKTVVGLQIDDTAIRAVQVSNPAGSAIVERFFCHKFEDPENRGRELLDVLRSWKLKPEMLISSLPTALAVVREIDLSMNNLKKLDKIVKYQMEPYVPYPIEDMVVDFFPPEPQRPVTVMGVQKTQLSEHLGIMAQAEIDPDVITLEDAALYFFYVHGYPGKTDDPVALVHLSGSGMVCQVIRRDRLELIRVVPGGIEELEGLKETLGLYELKYSRQPISEVLITGPEAGDPALIGRIEAFTGIKTSLWKPFDHIKNGGDDIGPDLQAELSVPLALAVGMSNASPKGLDLRKEEFSLKTAFDLKNLIIYALSASIVLVGLLTFHLYHRLSLWEGAYESANKRLNRVLVDTFPDIGTVIRGRELSQMQQKIAAEKNRYQWLEEIAATGSTLELLLVLTNVLSGTPDVKVDNVSIEGFRVLLDGRAPSFKIVDDLKGKLENTQFFTSTRLVGAKIDNQDRMVRFGFHLEKKK